MVSLKWASCLSFLTFALDVKAHPFHSHIDDAEPSENTTHLFGRSQPIWGDFNGDPNQPKVIAALQDMSRVVNLVLSDNKFYDIIFPKYFDSSHATAVKQVLTNMVQPDTIDGTGNSGSDLISAIIVNKNDDHGVCSSGEGSVGAYVWQTFSTKTPGQLIGNAEMVFCTSPTNVFAMPQLAWTPSDTCASLDAVVSNKMVTLGGYVLVHELAHVVDIGQAPVAPFYTGSGAAAYTALDPNKYIGDYAYGPQKVRQLLANPATAGRAVINADSYAWFVTETYWSIICGHTFGAPTSNANGVATTST